MKAQQRERRRAGDQCRRQSKLRERGHRQAIGPSADPADSPKSTCSPNQSARLAMTPTTAAVTAVSAPATWRLSRSRSMKGAPAKMKRNEGAKITHSCDEAPIVPATSGSSPVAPRAPARKPTKTSTRISGPGVVSASPGRSASRPGGASDRSRQPAARRRRGPHKRRRR